MSEIPERLYAATLRIAQLEADNAALIAANEDLPARIAGRGIMGGDEKGLALGAVYRRGIESKLLGDVITALVDGIPYTHFECRDGKLCLSHQDVVKCLGELLC